jgi:hypothetical protein
VIKGRRMKWSLICAAYGKACNVNKISVRKIKGRKSLGDLDFYGRTDLKLILNSV